MQESIDSIFKPDPATEKLYKEKLKALLDKKITKSQVIDMGPLPAMYSFLGIVDRELKTNGKTILKALGFEGRNKHHVQYKTIENLLNLTYDPKAVCKSLSKSDNPNAYIAVLDAKTMNDEQIIAILSPSNDGRGFMFIPSVYEKHSFDKYFDKICNEQKVLYIKNKGSELWGQLQSLPRHNPKPYINRILTKDDIVKRFEEISIAKMPKQGQTPSLERRNNNNKENTMADLIWFSDEDTSETRACGNKSFVAHEKAFPTFSKVGIVVFGDRGGPDIRRTVQGNLDTIKKLIENTITHLGGKEKERNLDDIEKALDLQIKEYEQSQIQKAQSPSLGRRINNNKEITMSDEFEGNENKNLSPKELAYQNATWQKKVVSDALKNGNLCCLPGKDGYADTAPALNLMNGNIYHGANLLYLKEHQRENGFPTGEYATKEQIDRAQKDMPDLIIRKGQKGVSLNISEQNEKGEYEDKHIRLFNVVQLNKPKNFKEWVEQKRQDKQEEFWQSQYGTKYEPPEPKKKAPGPEISCTSTEPAKYLGQYLAAVSMGGKFKATPEQGKEFSQKMEAAMYEKTLTAKTSKNAGELVSNPFALSKIGVEASKECKNFMKGLRADHKVDQKQELNLEQKQEHKRTRKR